MFLSTLALFSLISGVFGGPACPTSVDILAQASVDTLWSATTHPVAYPPNAAFSPWIVVSHVDSFKLFELGQPASPGVKQVAETGNTSMLVYELNLAKKAGAVLEFKIGRGLLAANGDVDARKIYYNQQFPTISFMAMIVPSPDWFIGYSSKRWGTGSQHCFAAFRQDVIAYDAGTDSGISFTSPNNPTVPPGVITQLTCGNGVFCTSGVMLPLAQFYFDLLCQDPPQTMYGVFESTWSSTNTIGTYPANPTIDSFIVASHSGYIEPIKVGRLASPGAAEYGRSGNATLLLAELEFRKSIGLVEDYKMYGPIKPGTKAYFSFTTSFSKEFSIFAKQSPSPDWLIYQLIGTCSNLINRPTTRGPSGMYAISMGVESGVDWASVPSPISPPTTIHQPGASFGMGFVTLQAGCSGNRTYDVELDTQWSAVNQPLLYPANAHFSPMVIAAHSSAYTMWRNGGYASPGMKLIAETGMPGTLEGELSTAMGANTVKSQTTTAPILGSGTGKSMGTITADTANYLMSSATMLAPSPDWFTGTSSFEMCVTNNWVSSKTMNTLVWDAGTDSGMTFTAADSATIPPAKISEIMCGNVFCSGSGPIPTVASVKLTSKCLGMKTFTITLNTLWSAARHPLNYPSNALFSPLVVAAHNTNYTMWALGALVSPSAQQVAETGNPTLIQTELSNAQSSGSVGDYQTATGPIAAFGTARMQITVSSDHPYISMMSMLFPSPDWFTGVSMLDMCDHSTGKWKMSAADYSMEAYDAGTDNGTLFTSANSPETPHAPVSRIICGGGVFCTSGVMPVIATVVLGTICKGSKTFFAEFQSNWLPLWGSSRPSNAHWSPMIFAAHGAGSYVWRRGVDASQGVVEIAEFGMTTTLESELNATGIVWSRAPGIPMAVGKTRAYITVTEATPLVSSIGMIAPSPDWFSGVDSVDMCDGTTGMWKGIAGATAYAWDAGTDSGTTFTSPNAPNPPTAVSEILCGGVVFCGGPVGGQISIGSVFIGTPCSGVRSYNVAFKPTWSAVTNPVAYPSNAHWSPVVAAAHGPGFSLWTDGGMASGGVQLVAETGAPAELQFELNAAKDVLSYATASGPIPTGSGIIQVAVQVDGMHSFISLISMIAPSPDWFSGVDSENMCDFFTGTWRTTKQNILYAWDAGTDSGSTFTSPNNATSPRQPISQIINCGQVFCMAGGHQPELGTVVLEATCPGLRTYQFQFRGRWTPQAQPLNFPPSAQFTPFLAVSHSNQFDLFTLNAVASTPLQQFILGQQSIFNPNVITNDLIGPALPTGVGVASVMIQVDASNPRISTVARLMPSLDYFTGGVFPMCDVTTGSWLVSMSAPVFGYDAGVINATGIETVPKNVMQLLCGTEFCASGSAPSFGTMSAGIPCMGKQYYEIEFTGSWNVHGQPLMLPGNNRLFSPMVAAAHNESWYMWMDGGMATPGVKTVAETGAPGPLEAELGAANGVCGFTVGQPIFRGEGSTVVGMEFNGACRFLSTISMLAPSPDWFTGVSGVDMCDGATGMWKMSANLWPMYPWDAGTDGGMYFNSTDAPLGTPVPIRQIECGGTSFCAGTGQVTSLGGIFIRQATRSPSASPSMTPSSSPSTTSPLTSSPSTTSPSTSSPLTSSPTTSTPSKSPSSSPSSTPSTSTPTTSMPSSTPSSSPSRSPFSTGSPSATPSSSPTTGIPTTAMPSKTPSSSPSRSPSTGSPSTTPSASPITGIPTTAMPSGTPTTSTPITSTPTTSAPTTNNPTAFPITGVPTTANPTARGQTWDPSATPTGSPTTAFPSNGPSATPSKSPVTREPTTTGGSFSPSQTPSSSPSQGPSTSPSTSQPSMSPTTGMPTTSPPTFSPLPAAPRCGCPMTLSGGETCANFVCKYTDASAGTYSAAVDTPCIQSPAISIDCQCPAMIATVTTAPVPCVCCGIANEDQCLQSECATMANGRSITANCVWDAAITPKCNCPGNTCAANTVPFTAATGFAVGNYSASVVIPVLCSSVPASFCQIPLPAVFRRSEFGRVTGNFLVQVNNCMLSGTEAQFDVGMKIETAAQFNEAKSVVGNLGPFAVELLNATGVAIGSCTAGTPTCTELVAGTTICTSVGTGSDGYRVAGLAGAVVLVISGLLC